MSDDEFIAIFNDSSSLRQAAERVGVSYGYAREHASRLRSMGHKLKRFTDVIDSHPIDITDENYRPKKSQPSRAVTAAPGSFIKIQELQLRVARSEPLWHPDDATYETCDRETIRFQSVTARCDRK